VCKIKRLFLSSALHLACAPFYVQTLLDLGTSGVQDNDTLTGTAVIMADARFLYICIHSI
jgi:hypothetical protein